MPTADAKPDDAAKPHPAHLAAAFGLRWASDAELPPFHPVAGSPNASPDIQVRFIDRLPVRDLQPAPPGSHVQSAANGFRYLGGAEVSVDAVGDDQLWVQPGPAWQGVLPPPFFATVTALLLARRGLLPLHGSAVAIDGAAVLLCGPAGTGKSTLTAALLAAGARLISDDLTILHPEPAGRAPRLFAGRRTLRLFPDLAGWLGEAVPWQAAPVIADRKLAVSPPQVEPFAAVPLRAVVVLTPGAPPTPPEVDPSDRGALLAAQLFRPGWMRRSPGHPLRLAALHMAARHLRLLRLPALEVRDPQALHSRGAQAMRFLRQQLPVELP